MEHAAPPNPAPEIAYAAVNAELSRSEPLWLYRMFLGITGVLIAETLFVFESGMKASILLSGPEVNLFLDYFWYTGGVVATAIEWFSALYLLAAPENPDERRARWTSPRKLLLITGSAWAVFYLMVPFLDRVETWARFLWFASTALHIAATVVLIYFLMRLSARTGDAFFARHFPLVLTLTLASLGLSLLIGISNYYDVPRALRRAGNLEQVLSAAASAYFAYLLIHLRRQISAFLWPPPAQKESPAEAGDSHQTGDL